MKELDLNGLIPATLTPMTGDFEVDEAALRKYIRWLVGHEGLKGIAVNMDTGEGPHLSRGEKKRIVSIWRARAGEPSGDSPDGGQRRYDGWKARRPDVLPMETVCRGRRKADLGRGADTSRPNTRSRGATVCSG